MDSLLKFVGKNVKITDKSGREYVGMIETYYPAEENEDGVDSIDIYLKNKPFMPTELRCDDIVSVEVILGK